MSAGKTAKTSPRDDAPGFNAVVALMLAREAAAHARGRAEGLEAAARMVDEWDAETAGEVAMLRAIADAIRALGGGGEGKA